MGAEGEEIPIFADVGEILHVRWIGMWHTGNTAGGVPVTFRLKGEATSDCRVLWLPALAGR